MRAANVPTLGHALGFVPLAAAFAAILSAERAARARSEAFYWLAIVTMRTAATNIADLLDYDLRIAPLLVLAALAGALALLVLGDRGALAPLRGRDGGVPATDARYWLTMLVAGVLGTALGDCAADDLGLDAGPAAALDLAVVAAVLALGTRARPQVEAGYWLAVAAVRTAGTNVGDWTVSRDGLGLPLSTALTGLAFGASVALWRPRPKLLGARAA